MPVLIQLLTVASDTFRTSLKSSRLYNFSDSMTAIIHNLPE